MRRLKVEAIDPGTMRAFRDITPLVSSSGGSIEIDNSNELHTSGTLKYVGIDTWLSSLMRVNMINDDGSNHCLGTFFATPKDAERTGRLIQGELQLDSTLLALSSTLLPSTYVATIGATAKSVIADMCRIAGRAALIDTGGGARYGEPVFFEAGTSCLSVAQEAAAKAGFLLSTDKLGYIILNSRTPNPGEAERWTTASGTDITSIIKKSTSWVSSPTRVIATYNDSENTISASASIPESELDAATRGRHIDATVNITDMLTPDIVSLRNEATKAIQAQQIDSEWSFTSLMRDTDAGVPCKVIDIDQNEMLTGIVSHITIKLDELLTMDVTVRGVTS